jgi:DNA-binding MarR family transcriptional regulator
MLSTIERAAHLIAVYLDANANDLGITQGEAHVLAALAQSGPAPIGSLHRDFGHKRSTLTNIIDRLEQRNLVQRTMNTADRRSFVVDLTPNGVQVAARVTEVRERLEHEIAQNIVQRDADGLELIVAVLSKAVRQAVD